MKKIIIDDCVYSVHPIYGLYAASKDGNIIHIIKQVPHKGNKTNTGYMICGVRKHGQSGQKKYQAHRFIWECFNGLIPDGKEIDHINNDKEDNRLCNLQLMTHQQNCKKAANDRDHTFTANSIKCVKAANKNTNEISYYWSMYAAQQHLKINAASVSKVCDGIYKSALSKKDGCSYTFEYVKKEDLPQNYIKSKNIRPQKATNEDKRKHRLEWWNKEYKCPKCGIVTKNNSKYKHIKKCSTQKQ